MTDLHGRASTAHVENSSSGVLLGNPETTFKHNKVLATGSQVITLGLITGVVFALLNAIFRYQRK